MSTKGKIENLIEEIKSHSKDKNFLHDPNVPQELKDELIQLLLEYAEEHPEMGDMICF